MDELDKVIHWQREWIGMKDMQIAVLRWMVANKADLGEQRIDGLMTCMEQALAAHSKKKPALAPAVA